MKKLMVAACAVAFAAGVQAANVAWGVGSAYDPATGTEMESGETPNFYAFFVFDTVQGSYDTYSYATAVSDVKSGNIAFLSNAAGGPELIDLGASDKVSINDGTSVGYLVILDAESIDNATKAYIVSETKSVEVISGNAQGTFNYSNLTDTKTPGSWYTVGAVPEPTSGLLLLLGVAGLALRRRRA